MLDVRKTRRAIAIGAAALTLAVSGAVAVAAPASATETQGGCRGLNPGLDPDAASWFPVAGGVAILPCSQQGGSNVVLGTLYFVGPAGLDIDPCEQLINVKTGAWAWNYQCAGWHDASDGQASDGSYVGYNMGDSPSLATGEYVVREGFWATINGVYAYYGDVESTPIWVNNG